MADLSKCPRGGWQIGNVRRERGRNFGPYSDENPDPAPDVFAVKREDGAFVVTHYPHVDDTKACCVVKVTPRAGESETEALSRADQMIERVHPQRKGAAA